MSGKSSKKGNAPSWEVVEKPFDVIRSSGRKLEGTLTYPEGESEAGPVVIFLHGTMSNRDHNFVPDLCKKLVKEHGLRSYRFDLRFDKDEFEPEHRYKFSGYADDIDDLECVVRSLRLEGFSPFCLFGHSRGANDVLLYASSRHTGSGIQSKTATGEEHEHDHHRVQSATSVAEISAELHETTDSSMDAHLLDPSQLAIVVAAPRFNMPNMLTTLFAADKIALLEEQAGSFPWESQRGELLVTKDDAKVVLSDLDMAQAVKNIPDNVPILLLHGTDDELIPCDDAAAYKSARETIEVTIVDGARHAFRGKKQLKQLLTVCSDWIGEKLRERGSLFTAAKTV